MFDLFLEKGKWPDFYRPYCREMLRGVLTDYYREQDLNGIVVLRGERAEEKSNQSKRRNVRFIKRDGVTYFAPIYFSKKDAGEKIIAENGLPVWEGYERGLKRTACRICPGQRTVAYAVIRKDFPDIWEELTWLEKRLGLGVWREINGVRGSFKEMADKGDINLSKKPMR